MKSIQHLSPEEQQHFILCDCGQYLDMRSLAEVFEHLHVGLPKPEWTHSLRKDHPTAYLKSGKKVDLN
ncbi:MAG TPA: hypothetical protein VI385_04530 [Flavisolibacter sp.]